jgi:histidyl-tRNA synthetase
MAIRKKTQKAKKADPKDEVKKKKPVSQLLRGFKDILPEDEAYWNYVCDSARRFSEAYSFARIRLPYLEQAKLFERSIGDGTDIIDKEMYTFEDASGDKVAMRPEATAQIARAYIEHGMLNMPQPVKLWYLGPMFRHDRPQAGRYRQFWQWGLESLGSDDPIVDAQIVLVLHRFMKELGLDVTIRINSIGSPEARKDYIAELVSYFKKFRKDMSDVDKKRLQSNPLRLLDSKEEGMEELIAGAPQIVDWLDDDSKEHFMTVLDYLTEANVPYELDPFLVRGLDYYSRTVFEIYTTDSSGKRKNALGGGGRYDALVEELGGREDFKGAIGAAIGIERVILALKEAKVKVPAVKDVDVFFCQLGDAARKKGLILFEDFREAGISVAEAFGKGSLKAQLELADKHGAKLAIILGQKEVLDGTIIIRDMDSGTQEIVDASKVVALSKKRVK